ncbi:MAG: hypothetical protein FWC68_03680 [Oscillospiraceae bacterium]|nr:hypothetical protein [Oscillospiraceae bacterium]
MNPEELEKRKEFSGTKEDMDSNTISSECAYNTGRKRVNTISNKINGRKNRIIKGLEKELFIKTSQN